MRFLLEPAPADTLADLVEAGRAARDNGLDGVLLSDWPAPLVAVAALVPAVDGILVAAEVPLGDRHPVELAEEAAVVDVAAAGRLILAVRPGGADRERFEEAIDLLRRAGAAGPFRHAGAHWNVPAGLAQNSGASGGLARVTPAPFQPRLELWTSGPCGGSGPGRGLGHLSAQDDDPAGVASMWDAAERRLGPALIGAPRAGRHTFSTPARLLEQLQAGRHGFGQDWAVVRAPASAAAAIGGEVRPRVQLDSLPPRLETYWSSERRTH